MGRKSHTLPDSTQEKIARAYTEAKNAGKRVSYNSLAARYRCTPQQVRNYVAKFEAGAYAGKRGRKQPPPEETQSDAEIDTVAIIDNAIRDALRKLNTEDLSPSEIITIGQRAVRTLRDLMLIKIENHLRGVDAEFIPFLVRWFLPTATDVDVVKVIEEVKVAWKDLHD